MKLSQLLCLSCLALTLAPLGLEAGLPPSVNNQALPSLSKIVQPVMATVVNIEAKNTNPSASKMDASEDQGNSNDNATPNPKRVEKGFNIGSGVIIDASKGYVITNAHLVNKNNSFSVTLSDGRRFKARLIGKDAASDIAVLQINANNLVALPFANSDTLKVGDFVIAIGNPYGLDQTVTSGIISALRRSDLGIEGYEDFIQTDASINPGNSGGALVNLKGELVGINTAILAPSGSGGNVGIGFAIPSNMAQSVANQIIKYGKVDRGIVGIMMQTLTPELATAFHDDMTKGAIITMVNPLSPADKAGLKLGDVITAVNGQKVETASQVKNSIGLMRSGSHMSLSILRNGKPMTITLVSANPDAYQNQVANQNPFFFGTMLQNYDTIVPSYGHVKGVQILDLDENTPAWQAGLRPGDIILTVSNNPVQTTDQLAKYSQNNDKTLLVSILRDSGAAFVLLKR